MNGNHHTPRSTSEDHSAVTPADLYEAAEVDAWITAHQAGGAAPPHDANTTAEMALAADLLALTEIERADPAFVAELEHTLHERATAASESHRAYPIMRHWLRTLVSVRSQHRPVILGAALTTLLLALLLTMPVTRAALHNVLYSLAFVEPRAISTTPVAVVDPVSPNESTGTMSLDEIRSSAPFAVATPSWLPADLRFTGGYVDEGLVSLVYHPSAGEISPGAPALLLLISEGAPAAPPLLPDDQRVWTQVHDQPAIYLHGGWQGERNGDTVRNLRWVPALDAAWLTWEEAGLTYFLQADGLGLEMEAMRRIAESLRIP